MSPTETAKNLLQRANAWVGRNVLYIGVAVLFLSLGVAAMINYYGDKAEQAVVTNPPVTKKQAQKLVQAKNQAKAEASYYKQKARRDSASAVLPQRLATLNKDAADSLRSVYETIPATSPASLVDIARALSVYQSPDTSATE